MKTTTEANAHVGYDEIARLAKRLWESEGRQTGRDLDYWLQAERELLSARSGTSNALLQMAAATGDGHDGLPAANGHPGLGSRFKRKARHSQRAP